MSFTHKRCDDQLVIYGDLFYQNVKTHNELAPSATGSFQTTGQVTLAIPPNMPIANGAEPPKTPTYEDDRRSGRRLQPVQSVQSDHLGRLSGASARIRQSPVRQRERRVPRHTRCQGRQVVRWELGLRFRITVIARSRILRLARLVSTSRFNRILNRNDPIFNPASDQFIGTTVPFNPFGDYRVSDCSQRGDDFDFATVHPKDVDTSELWTLDLEHLHDGVVQASRLVAVGFAFGGQFRREKSTQDIDQLNLDGDIIGSSPPPAHRRAGRIGHSMRRLTSRSSARNGHPGFHALEFTAAVRYEEFRNNNTNVLVPKFGMRWQPFDDNSPFVPHGAKASASHLSSNVLCHPTSGLLTD